MMSWTYFTIVLLAVTSITFGSDFDPDKRKSVIGAISELDTIYLPFDARSNQVALNSSAVETVAFDPKTNLIYVGGREIAHVVDASYPDDLKRLFSQNQPGVSFTDVEVCGHFVYATAEDLNYPTDGQLRIYRALSSAKEYSLELVQAIKVGVKPVDVEISKDCQTVVVTVKATPFTSKDGKFVDPKGLILIIKFPKGPEYDAVIKAVDFVEFDSRVKELEKLGVRFIFREYHNTFSRDVEPTIATLDEANYRVFVSLQANNAIVEVDLNSGKIVNIGPLGSFLWGNFDASDKDNGIRISYWQSRSFYQPEGIQFFHWKGRDLIFSANEGDTKVYPDIDFDETRRGNTFRPEELSDKIPKYIQEALHDDSKLGRLVLSKYDGLNKYGQYEQIFHFGTRSFSIWDANTLKQLFDSDAIFEETTALYCPHLFNSKGRKIDTRSDNMGSEPVSVRVLEIEHRLYIFVLNEKPGTIHVFSIGEDPRDAKFENIFCAAFPHDGQSFKNLKKDFEARILISVNPEELVLVKPKDSPTGSAALILPGSVSGTVTVLAINDGRRRGVGKRVFGRRKEFVPRRKFVTRSRSRSDVFKAIRGGKGFSVDLVKGGERFSARRRFIKRRGKFQRVKI